MSKSHEADNHRRLHNLFAELNARHFSGTLPSLILRFSGRLKTTGGQYFKKPERIIQISTRYLAMEQAWDEIRDTLGHEMIHYWLDFLGRPCGHTPEFRAKLRECGFNRYSRLTPVRARYLYRCPTCCTPYYRKRLGVWSCGPCSGPRFNPAYRLVLAETLKTQEKKPHALPLLP